MSSKKETKSGFWLREQKLGIQVSPGLGGVTVSLVRAGSGEKNGLQVADRIVGVGDTLFDDVQWIEKAAYEKLLSDAKRPVFVTFKTARAGFQDLDSLTSAAWDTILGFIKSDPSRAKGIGKLFSEWDTDHSGSLTCGELCQALVSFGVTLTKRELEAFRDSLDANGDGSISLDEFSRAVVAQHKQSAAHQARVLKQSQDAAAARVAASTSRKNIADSGTHPDGALARRVGGSKGREGGGGSMHSRRDHMHSRSADGHESDGHNSDGGGFGGGGGFRGDGGGAKQPQQTKELPEPPAADFLSDLPQGLWEPQRTAPPSSPIRGGGGGGEGEERRGGSVDTGVPPPLSEEQRRQCLVFAQHARNPFAAAWLKVLDFLRGSVENTRAVHLAFQKTSAAAEGEAACTAAAAAEALTAHASFLANAAANYSGSSSSSRSSSSGGLKQRRRRSSFLPYSIAVSSPFAGEQQEQQQRERVDRAAATTAKAGETARVLARSLGVKIVDLGFALTEIGIPFTGPELAAWCRGVSEQKKAHQQQREEASGGSSNNSKGLSSSFVTLGEFTELVRRQRRAERSEVVSVRVWQHVLAFQDGGGQPPGEEGGGSSFWSIHTRLRSLERIFETLGTDTGQEGGAWQERVAVTAAQLVDGLRIVGCSGLGTVQARQSFTQHLKAHYSNRVSLQNVVEATDDLRRFCLTPSPLLPTRSPSQPHHELAAPLNAKLQVPQLQNPPPPPQQQQQQQHQESLSTVPDSSSSSTVPSSKVEVTETSTSTRRRPRKFKLSVAAAMAKEEEELERGERESAEQKKKAHYEKKVSSSSSSAPPSSSPSSSSPDHKAESKQQQQQQQAHKQGGVQSKAERDALKRRDKTQTEALEAVAAMKLRDQRHDGDDGDDGGGGGGGDGNATNAAPAPPPPLCLSLCVGQRVAMRDDDGSWSKGTVEVAGVTGRGKLSAPKVCKDGWDKAYAWEHVRMLEPGEDTDDAPHLLGPDDEAADEAAAAVETADEAADEAAREAGAEIEVGREANDGEMSAGVDDDGEGVSVSRIQSGVVAPPPPPPPIEEADSTTTPAVEEEEEEEEEEDIEAEVASFNQTKNLESSMAKLLQFIQADKSNAVSVSTLFVRHENIYDKGGRSGIPVQELMAEFGGRLSVGFSAGEAAAFKDYLNGEPFHGLLNLKGFTGLIADANAKARATAKKK